MDGSGAQGRVGQVGADPFQALGADPGGDRLAREACAEDAVQMAEGDVVGGGDRGRGELGIRQGVQDEGPDAAGQEVAPGFRRQGGLGVQDVGEEGGDQVERDRAQAGRVGRLDVRPAGRGP
ncbi:hypothetical protein GCM10017752_01680 [Streptomyces roseoviridis]